jgi:hypothetical protein
LGFPKRKLPKPSNAIEGVGGGGKRQLKLPLKNFNNLLEAIMLTSGAMLEV